MSDIDSERSIYIYQPNAVAPIIFAIAFAGLGVGHIWECYRYKSWKWTFLHPLCCFLFATGFALRSYGAYNYTFTKLNLNVYIASICLIYMAPPLLELVNYHILGRILYYVPNLSPIHPGRVLTTFGLLSTIVEVLNAIGVAYSANPALPERYATLGHALMKTSLIIQLVVIGLFAILASVFFMRCCKTGILNWKIKTPLSTLYVSMGLILARTIYRTEEYFIMADVGPASVDNVSELHPILRKEWYFWVFEAALMLLNSALWSIWHPGRFLPMNKNVHLMEDGVTEVEGAPCEDQRTFLATLFDPFGFFMGGREKTQGKMKESLV